MSPPDVLKSEEEEMTPSEVQAFARAVYDEACSIQKLLQEYTEKTRTLGEEVGGFVQRDTAEEDALQKIAIDVAYAEMGALRNTRYVEYSQRRMQMEIEREDGGAEAGLSLTDRRDQGLAMSCFASLCDGKPDAFFNLSEYGDVCDVLLGWRSVTPTSQAQFDSLYELIAHRLPNLLSCVMLVNGVLYTPDDAFDSRDFTRSGLETMLDLYSVATPEEALTRWLDAVVLRSLLTRDRLHGVWNTAGELKKVGLCLLGDGHDTLTIVEHTRLLRSAVFRGFFFSGQLRAVESVGAQANLIYSLFKANDSESQQRVEKRVVDLFRNLEKQTGGPLSACKNAVVLLAVQSASINSTTTNFNSNTEVLAGMSFVVLDIRPLAPNIPFNWHLKWTEVCALGQLDAASGEGNYPLSLPVFKTTRVTVASLQSYDTLTHEVFPLLNECLRGAHQHSRAIVSSIEFGFVAATIAVVVTVGIFGRGFLSKSSLGWFSSKM